MAGDIHPQDKLDALQWAINQLRFKAPQGGYSEQIDRNRLHTLEQLRDEAEELERTHAENESLRAENARLRRPLWQRIFRRAA